MDEVFISGADSSDESVLEGIKEELRREFHLVSAGGTDLSSSSSSELEQLVTSSTQFPLTEEQLREAFGELDSSKETQKVRVNFTGESSRTSKKSRSKSANYFISTSTPIKKKLSHFSLQGEPIRMVSELDRLASDLKLSRVSPGSRRKSSPVRQSSPMPSTPKGKTPKRKTPSKSSAKKKTPKSSAKKKTPKPKGKRLEN